MGRRPGIATGSGDEILSKTDAFRQSRSEGQPPARDESATTEATEPTTEATETIMRVTVRSVCSSVFSVVEPFQSRSGTGFKVRYIAGSGDSR